jgi:hypothetical protein
MFRRHTPPGVYCIFRLALVDSRDSSTYRVRRFLKVRGSRQQQGTANSSLLLFDCEFRCVSGAPHFRDLPERESEADDPERQTRNAQCFA